MILSFLIRFACSCLWEITLLYFPAPVFKVQAPFSNIRNIIYRVFCIFASLMKLFSFILSLYIVFLTTIPCVDDPAADHSFCHETSQSPGTSGHNSADQCSPFCVCNCCGTPVIEQSPAIIPACLSFSHRDYKPFETINPSVPVLSIWQPPKLS